MSLRELVASAAESFVHLHLHASASVETKPEAIH